MAYSPPKKKVKSGGSLRGKLRRIHSDTLAMARRAFHSDIFSTAGTTCSICDRFGKTYTYTLWWAMAHALCVLYMAIRDESPDGEVILKGGWIHVANYWLQHFDDNAARTQYSKLQHWGFIYPSDHLPHAGSRGSGFWRLTKKGRQFVLGKIRVPRSITLFDNKVVGIATGTISVQEALVLKFDYAVLMGTK